MAKNELNKPLLDLLQGHDMNQIIDFPTSDSGIRDLKFGESKHRSHFL